MSYYSANIPRCTHIKTNGTQCGSPAVRGRRFCFFHKSWHGERIPLGAQPAPNLDPSFTLPVLEDADSIQVALMQVMRLILARQIEPKMAGLLLYALQTASLNLRHTELEPRPRERIVIDPSAASDSVLGEDLWHRDDFEAEEEDDLEEQVDGKDEEDAEDEQADRKQDADVTTPPRLGAAASTGKVDRAALRHQIRSTVVSGLLRSFGVDLPPEAFPPEAFSDRANPKQQKPQPGAPDVIDPLSPVPLE
jgi:hypothetical protein